MAFQRQLDWWKSAGPPFSPISIPEMTPQSLSLTDLLRFFNLLDSSCRPQTGASSLGNMPGQPTKPVDTNATASDPWGAANGIVEIAALTALVGSTTAESLILGDRGAAGMAWAAMSSFGSLFLMKASIAAATPAWLRETMGVSNQRSNAAVGLSVPFSRAMKVGGHTIGIKLHFQKISQDFDEPPEQQQIRYLSQEEVRHFDHYTNTLLSRCALIPKDRPAQPYIYARDALYWSQRHLKRTVKDWIGLVVSSIKLVEFLLLYRMGAKRLAWITTLNWAFFFIGAVILQMLGVSREIEDTGNIAFRMDILQGDIPMTQTPGDKRRVLLDVPPSVRRHLAWRIIWILGAAVCGYSLVALYITLSGMSRESFPTWAGFQCLWLVLRLMYFQFADEIVQINHSLAPLSQEKLATPQIRMRILALTVALSQQQTTTHPRGAYCYSKDTDSPTTVAEYLKEVNFEIASQLDDYTAYNTGDTIQIEIVAAFGDTLMSSVAWMTGMPFDGMDLYDSCLLVVKAVGNSSTVIVPVTRVLSGPPKSTSIENDQEKNISSPNFVPKGGSNTGTNLSWVFWIPAGLDRWLYLKADLDFLGTHEVVILSDSEVTKRLQIGDLYIGLKEVYEVKETVMRSTAVGRSLCDMTRIFTSEKVIEYQS